MLHNLRCEKMTLNYLFVTSSYIWQRDCLVQSKKSVMHILGNVHDWLVLHVLSNMFVDLFNSICCGIVGIVQILSSVVGRIGSKVDCIRWIEHVCTCARLWLDLLKKDVIEYFSRDLKFSACAKILRKFDHNALCMIKIYVILFKKL